MTLKNFLDEPEIPNQNESMKSWQHGYELDYLKELESKWASYNSYARGPFAEYKKNNIAQDLHDGNLHLGEVSFVSNVAKVKSAITLYNGVVIGYKQPGDVVITKLIYDANNKEAPSTTLYRAFENYNYSDIWVYVWAEDKATRSYIEQAGFKYVGSKITTFSEIYAIYFLDGGITLDGSHRVHPTLDPIEYVTLKKIGNVYKKTVKEIQTVLNGLHLEFTDHYSNYNHKHAWGALSLRGYYADWKRIEKPGEMSKAWKKEHAHETPVMQDTKLYNHFPMVYDMLQAVFGKDTEYHRIRFMRLAPGGGELQRHTDIVDSDAGYGNNQLMRFHFPIQTNDKVIFSAWDLNGDKIDLNLKEGEFGILDTRKPHMVVNGGGIDRIHLVIDVVMNENVRKLILNDTGKQVPTESNH